MEQTEIIPYQQLLTSYSMGSGCLTGYLPDFASRSFFKGEVLFKNGRIISIHRTDSCQEQFILPGLVDSHIHIESSLLLPYEFGKWVFKFGTLACIADPHEIANVLGKAGIEFLIQNAKENPVNLLFGAPSCVPATEFETSGSRISCSQIEELFEEGSCHFLGEMMNYPGIIAGNPVLREKLRIALKYNFPVDGHAPMLNGAELARYVAAGIGTDHECSTLEEAREKLELGMKIQIREGSAAKNFNTLHPLIAEFPTMLMFCSDDSHPDELIHGHIDKLVRRGLKLGYSIFDLIQIASINPVLHYKLDMGLLQVGDSADFILVDSLENFKVTGAYSRGRTADSWTKEHTEILNPPNQFYENSLSLDDLKIPIESNSFRIIALEDGQLFTREERGTTKIEDNFLLTDPGMDLLKLVVLNRYIPAKPQLAIIRGFGLSTGALASSVAHDSHNILAVGVNDSDILRAIQLVQKNKGALVAVSGDQTLVLPLPCGGIISTLSFETLADTYSELNAFAQTLNSPLKAPFMTLSFMALLVIPELKLGDKGLFDGLNFEFCSLFVKDPESNELTRGIH